ncbi:hypothetical protein L3V83_13750 [Thiotrichales bacterium 19X7-9]|nr:hypothetical protein [Thiotrichales bacterium 19X7-9]
MGKIKTLVKLLLIANIIILATACSNNNDQLATKEQVQNLKEYAEKMNTDTTIKNQIGYGMTVQDIIDIRKKLLESSVVSENEVQRLKHYAIQNEASNNIIEKIHYGMKYSQYKDIKETIDSPFTGSFLQYFAMICAAYIVCAFVHKLVMGD